MKVLLEKIKDDIELGMKKLTIPELKSLAEENTCENGDILLFVFALNELEERLSPSDYAKYELILSLK